jgi:predicted nucleic acid-binding Zn ribbon protein
MTAWDLRSVPPEHEPENACEQCGRAIEADSYFCSANCGEEWDRQQVADFLAGREVLEVVK